MSEELDTDAVREHHYGFKKRGGTFVNCMGCTRNYGGYHEYHASNASTICDECDLSAGDPIHRSAGTPDWDMAPGRWALIRNGEVVATAGPGSQGLSPDWVPVEQVTRNWSHEPDARELGLCEPTQLGPEDYPEDHACPYGCECPAPDPSCGLCHPHSATSRCAGA